MACLTGRGPGAKCLAGWAFLSLNADLERDDVEQAQQVMTQLKTQLLKNGLDPQRFARLKQTAIARQAWAVQGNSALADYYWSALGDYDESHFADPAKRLQTVTLNEANHALRQLFAEPGYVPHREAAVQLQRLERGDFGSAGAAGVDRAGLAHLAPSSSLSVIVQN